MDQLHQEQQVAGAKVGPSSRDGHEGIGRHQVCPTGRERMQALLGVSAQHPVLAPGLGVGDEIEFLPVERVIGVDDPNALPFGMRIGCS